MILSTVAGCAVDTDTGEHIDPDGSRRPWSDSERAWVTGVLARVSAEDLRSQIRATLAAGIEAFTAYRDTAAADIPVATSLQADCDGPMTAAQTIAGTAFTAAAAYTPGQLQAVADAVKATAARQAVVFSRLAGVFGWRAAVDDNAVKTDQALIYLAHLAQVLV